MLPEDAISVTRERSACLLEYPFVRRWLVAATLAHIIWLDMDQSGRE